MNKQRILTPVLLAAFFAVGATACEREGGTSGTSPAPSQRAPDSGAGTQERSPSTSPTQPGTTPSQPGGSTGSGTQQ